MGAMPFHWLDPVSRLGTFGQRRGNVTSRLAGHMLCYQSGMQLTGVPVVFPSRADDLQTRESCVLAVYGSHKQNFGIVPAARMSCACKRNLVSTSPYKREIASRIVVVQKSALLIERNSSLLQKHVTEAVHSMVWI